MKCVLLWRFFFWTILFRFKPANRKSVLIELISFKILFSVKFQVSTFSENYHLLVKFFCESACKNLDAIRARSAVCFFRPILQLSKKSWWPPLWWLPFSYVHASSDVCQHTISRSRVATLLSDTDSRSRSTKLSCI